MLKIVNSKAPLSTVSLLRLAICLRVLSQLTCTQPGFKVTKEIDCAADSSLGIFKHGYNTDS